MGDFFQPASLDRSGSKFNIIDFQPATISSKISFYLQQKSMSLQTFQVRFRKNFMAADAPLWAAHLGLAYDSTISSIYALGSAFIGFLEHLGVADSMGADSLGGWMVFFCGNVFLLFSKSWAPQVFFCKENESFGKLLGVNSLNFALRCSF